MKTATEAKDKAVTATAQAAKSAQSYIKENKTEIVSFAKDMQKVGDGVAVAGGAAAVAGAPIAGVGAAPGTIVAGAGGIYKGIGFVVEVGTELLTGGFGNAAGADGKEAIGRAAGIAADKMIDSALPGPTPHLPDGAKKMLSNGIQTTITVVDHIGD